jgi:hypothetical protein
MKITTDLEILVEEQNKKIQQLKESFPEKFPLTEKERQKFSFCKGNLKIIWRKTSKTQLKILPIIKKKLQRLLKSTSIFNNNRSR